MAPLLICIYLVWYFQILCPILHHLTSKIRAYIVVITSQETVQNFGYVPVIVELCQLQASGSEKRDKYFVEYFCLL
jgi:hypothetical protein